VAVRRLTMTRRAWLQVGRVVVFCVFAFFGVLFLGWKKVGPAYLGVSGVVILTAVLDTVVRRLRGEEEWQAWVVILFDSLLIAVLVSMAGGFDGPFSTMFFVHAVVGGVYLGIRGGAAVATADTLMLAGMAYLSVTDRMHGGVTVGAIESVKKVMPHASVQYSVLFVSIYAGFLMVTGLVSGYLSRHLIMERGRADGMLRQLRAARTMSQKILESLSDGILVIDGAGRPVSINSAGRKILGLGDDWSDEVMNTGVYTLLKEFRRTRGMPSTVEVSLGGRVVECRMGTFLNHGGVEAGALVAMTDITETYELKKKLQEQEKLAAVGKLSSTLAHEIRNPLASMSGAAHVLRMGTLDWRKADRMTELICNQASRISEIIEGYLELSRNTKVMYSDPVSLEDVVREAVEVAGQGFASHVRVEMALEGDFIVFGNQARLVQMLTNVLRNAAEALESSRGGLIRVTLAGAREKEGMAELTVSDNGPGIPEKARKRIFDPFFTTKEEGTGLGLFVARKVAADHGGSMEIESSPGEGTRVRILLPIASPDAVSSREGGYDE